MYVSFYLIYTNKENIVFFYIAIFQKVVYFFNKLQQYWPSMPELIYRCNLILNSSTCNTISINLLRLDFLKSDGVH